MGRYFQYANEGFCPSLAYTQGMILGVPKYNYFVDEAGKRTKLENLLSILYFGDTLVLGSITDLMLPDTDAMTKVLTDLEERGISVISRLQMWYTLDSYLRFIEFY